MNGGCLGHIPEILDGDSPHTPRGCDAQAWSVSEVYRVWQLLTGSGEFQTPTSSAEPPVGRHE
jgi:glycogen debranching enzyme